MALLGAEETPGRDGAKSHRAGSCSCLQAVEGRGGRAGETQVGAVGSEKLSIDASQLNGG